MMKEPFGGLILNVAFRMLVPFTIVYGVYRSEEHTSELQSR